MTNNKIKNKFSWYWHRLKCMSLPEMNFRLQQICRKHLMHTGLLSVHTVPTPKFHNESKAYIGDKIPEAKKAAHISAADTVLATDIPFFASNISVDELTRNWNRDPKSGITAPLQFGPNLDYKDQSLVGDIKYLWEPNRHLFLVPLAQAYCINGDQRYLNVLESLLGSWIRQCPYLKGPNWTSSLELGIRLINWSIVWQLIGGMESPLFKGDRGSKFLNKWLDTIYRHAHFIRNHFSRYSSANNHLIGESAGLFVACVTWPFWEEFNDWRDESTKILIDQIGLQNADDGVNLEQAISYQQFVLDFFIIAGLAGRANKINFPSFYWSKIKNMIAFVGSMMDAGGNMPMIGDADDGYVVQLSPEKDFCPYKSLLATGAVLFKRADFKAKVGKLDDKTVWLLGTEAADTFNAISTGSEKSDMRQSFAQGGYYLIGSDFDTPQEIKSTIDCGPLGYLSIAAHGHADALSICLSVGGNEILIDPGTYAYHTQTRWRNYFRGTSAHNTVRLDGMDQSQISGNFMWASKANAHCRVFEINNDKDHFIGYHDGYQRLTDPVTHEREIVFDKNRLMFMLNDQFKCKDRHIAERFFHFSEQCQVDVADNYLKIINNGYLIEIKPSETDSHIELHYGNDEIPLGWSSRRYDQKVPTFSAVFRTEINGNSCLRTNIIIHSKIA